MAERESAREKLRSVEKCVISLGLEKKMEMFLRRIGAIGMVYVLEVDQFEGSDK